MKESKGITLIALVVTIVVLLILAGVSISMLTGENGIIKQAQESKIETRAGTVEERKNIWKTEQKTDEYLDANTSQSLEELLNDLEKDNYITTEERTQIEETGHVKIGSKDISFSNGLVKEKYTITNSKDEVKFKKIIKEVDILIEKPNFTNYTIEGISNSKDGEYVTSGSVEGKSGKLEIVGDINDTTFSYVLTDFMQGDEIFYCKINIDEENYYKEINIIQGNSVIYEEDFVGIIISELYQGHYEIVEDERFSSGKAIKFEGQGFTDEAFRFSVTCTQINLLTMIPVVESTVNTSKAANTIQMEAYSDSEMTNLVDRRLRIYDTLEANVAMWNINDPLIEFNERKKYYIKTIIFEEFYNSEYPVFDRGNEFYLDGLEIIK